MSCSVIQPLVCTHYGNCVFTVSPILTVRFTHGKHFAVSCSWQRAHRKQVYGKCFAVSRHYCSRHMFAESSAPAHDRWLLGNSGKPIALETSRLMKFVMQVFRDKELTKIWSMEFMKSRSHECAASWTPELSKSQSRERAIARSLEPARPWSCEFVKTQSREPAKPRTSGICEIWEYIGERVLESRCLKTSWTRTLTNQQEAKSKLSS
jgi:hypothetical protein